MQITLATLDISLMVPLILKRELLFYPAMPLLGNIQRNHIAEISAQPCLL
jgi:hypothetical protein